MISIDKGLQSRNEVLDRIRMSLENYPNQGGDIGIMAAVDRIKEQTELEARIKEARVFRTRFRRFKVNYPGFGVFDDFDDVIRKRRKQLRARLAELEKRGTKEI